MKKFLIISIALILAFPSYAQQYGYNWRFGVSGGISNYFGDIRPLGVNNFRQFSLLFNRYRQYADDLSFQISVERSLGNSVGLMFTAGSYQFGSADRFVQNDGTLFTEGQNFDRALNFQTNLYDGGLSLVFKPDNNWLLSGKSIIAPYFVFGFGVQTFNVFGDLLDENGGRYDYTNFQTIPDGTFETNLSDLETELPGGYKNVSLYAHLGLGFRIRVTNGIEIFAQSDFKRAASDYLDDVAGQYRQSYDSDFQEYAAKPGTNIVDPVKNNRGLDNGKPDWYLYHGIGVKFSFGPNKASFKTPVVVPRYTFVPDELSQNQLAKSDSLTNKNRGNTSYVTVIQLPSWQESVSQSDSLSLDSATVASIENMRLSLMNEKESLQSGIDQNQDYLNLIEGNIEKAKADTTVSPAFTQTRLSNLDSEKSRVQVDLGLLTSRDASLQDQLDSLDAIKGTPVKYASESETKELLIYPGQVSKILYSTGGPTQVYLDSISSRQPTSSETTMTREEMEEELERFRSEMIQAQAKRDSAMIMAFASKIPDAQQTEQADPQELVVNTEGVDEKTAKKIEKNRKKQEKLDEKNNELLKDALLIGGTAATTAAIANSGDKKEAAAQAQRDSVLMAQIQLDSVRIDSLEKALALIESPATDTIQSEKLVLMSQSKLVVYFEVNETLLSQTEMDKLAELKELLDKNPQFGVELVGFADNTGSISYNLQISKNRVASVKAFLEKQGIDSSRISSDVGGLIVRGSEKGSVDQDRKVEIRILEMD